MKKSEMYKMAQKAVADALFLSADVKVEVLRLLIEREDCEAWLEEHEADSKKRVQSDEAV